MDKIKEVNKFRDTKGRYAFDPGTRSQLALQELYRSFNFFNDRFADGKLPRVIITIQEAGRKNAYGWFARERWEDSLCNGSACEINLSAEHVGRNASATLGTLLHEMAHLWNAVNNIKDCSSGQYHNKHFKTAAEKFGLKVSRGGTRGYAYTELTQQSEDAIEELDLDHEMISSLQRKPMKSNSVKRYISLIVSADLEWALQRAIDISGLSKKEFVENSIMKEINKVTEQDGEAVRV